MQPDARPGSLKRHAHPLRELGQAAAAALFMLGLTTATWGWDDLTGLVAQPARAIALAALALRALSLPFFQPAAPRTKGLPGKSRVEKFFFPPLIAGAVLSLAAPYFDRRSLLVLPSAESVRYLGLALFLPGIALASWAQWHMGRFFSGHLMIQQGHRLLTDGPFAWVRHPRYAGLILVFMGWPLVFRSLLGLAGGLLCAGMFLIRIPREEALLARQFAAEWSAYASKTKRLVPRIY